MHNEEPALQNNTPLPRGPVYRKLTLTIDCEVLLQPTTQSPTLVQSYTHVSKSAAECVSDLQIAGLPTSLPLDQIKIRCFHTCAALNVQGEACLDTLWSVGDWLEERYRDLGRGVRCERLTDGHGRDWSEPDATLVVAIS
ncbi:hypothetical protein EKO04_010960 [Ascochyta lentis]|uniref:Uncharacterized protein n=1 Tax=Ascochyta lentis TaxID=205686 RepID=A0A8H7IVG5_9PLEO|nr:hypothetical protein EKO04_010960 [Ascochyta lentis]